MRLLHGTTATLMLLSLAACDKPPAKPKPTLHEVMAGSIDPVADVIWEESSKAYGEDGNAATDKLTNAEWLKIEQAARDLHDGAMVISDNPAIEATRPGVKILDEGVVAEAVTAAQVARYIERDRPGLARHARKLSTIARGIEAAAKAKDVSTTVRLSEELDDVCEACHKRFWYPEQPALVGKR